MIASRLAVVFLFLIALLVIINVVIPFMFPNYRYWWMFRKDKLDNAERKLEEVKEDITVNKIHAKADTLATKHLDKKESKSKEGEDSNELPHGVQEKDPE